MSNMALIGVVEAAVAGTVLGPVVALVGGAGSVASIKLGLFAGRKVIDWSSEGGTKEPHIAAKMLRFAAIALGALGALVCSIVSAIATAVFVGSATLLLGGAPGGIAVPLAFVAVLGFNVYGIYSHVKNETDAPSTPVTPAPQAKIAQ